MQHYKIKLCFTKRIHRDIQYLILIKQTKALLVSASTLCQVPGLSTHTVTAPFTQVQRPCAASHHMFQVCVNTGSCLYITVNYLHAARGCETYRISRPIRRIVIFSLEILEEKIMNFNFSNLLEENRIVTYRN
jgi:hypothetical protein